MANHFKNNNGFSIIELLFIIICLTVILTIVFPDFFSFYLFSEINNTSNVLINFIHTAKTNKAIFPQKDWQVLIDNNNIFLLENGTAFDSYKFSDNIALAAASDSVISFNPDGSTLKPSGYNIILNFRNNQYIIEVDNITGFINFQ